MKAIVVGGGLAGLAAADRLHGAGVEVELYEARDRVGGRVWSVPFAGMTVELGAEFIFSDNQVLNGEIRRHGLCVARKGTLYGYREPRGGGPVTLDEIAAALEPIQAVPPARGHSVRQAVAAAQLAPAVAEAICARLEVSCSYPADDLAQGALHEDAGAYGQFDTYTIEGGNGRLAAALAAPLGERIHLSSPVRRIAWSASGSSIETDRGGSGADAVVITVPPSVLEQIEFDPPLPASKARALAAVRLGQAAKLFVRLRRPAPPSATLSVPERYWCYTQLDPSGEPAQFVAAFAGTAAALAALELDAGPGRWVESLAELRPDLELDASDVVLQRWGQDPWVRGSYSARSARSPMDDDALAASVGTLVFAGEHTAGAWHGMMEGALRSGIRAGQVLLQ
jgi:monoamine oxidase